MNFLISAEAWSIAILCGIVAVQGGVIVDLKIKVKLMTLAVEVSQESNRPWVPTECIKKILDGTYRREYYLSLKDKRKDTTHADAD